MAYVKAFFISALFMLIIDMTWFSLLAKNIYASQLGHLLRKSDKFTFINWSAISVAYSMLLLGIFCFVLPKTNGSLWHAFLWGALFGAVVYGVYDFVNLGVLASWPLSVSIIDFVWGLILCSTTSMVATLILKW